MTAWLEHAVTTQGRQALRVQVGRMPLASGCLEGSRLVACSAGAWEQWVVTLPATHRAEVSLGGGSYALPRSSQHTSHPHFSVVLPMRTAAREGGQPHGLGPPAGLWLQAGLNVLVPQGYHYAWRPLEVCGHIQPEAWGCVWGDVIRALRVCGDLITAPVTRHQAGLSSATLCPPHLPSGLGSHTLCGFSCTHAVLAWAANAKHHKGEGA